MCGIAGILGLEGLKDPSATVRTMTDAMAHRGPDASGHWADDLVALGHRRLSIIDLSRAADQPFRSPDGRYVLVFNGEIYNFRELRSQLGDQVFVTDSDTEVLLAAYRTWGAEVLQRLHGMFAFAVYDARQRELFLARDRMGIKPLYFHRGDRHFVFASELRALLASELVPRRLDRVALVDHLRYQTVHAPRTLVEDVRMLMPGQWMRLSDEELTVKDWWTTEVAVDPEAATHEEARVHREVRERLTRAVERRLVADVPFGAFLSGGIDSSAVVALMASVSSAPVHTFSVVFDEGAYNEERFADLVSKRFRTDHTPIRLRPAEFLGMLPDALAAMDHPSGDGPNTWVVSKVTREAGITMALSGLGGDELFAGYPVFTRSLALWDKRWLAQFPAGARRAAGALLRTVRPTAQGVKAAELLRLPSFSIDDTYPVSRLAFTDQQLLGLLATKRLPANSVRAILHTIVREHGGHALPFLSQVSLGELATYLVNVLLRDTDQMSMAHALEVRVPFLDHELVSYVLGVRDGLKYPHSPKRLLTRSLGDLLPEEVVNRPKMGFTLPWEEWMRRELRDLCEQRLEGLAQRDLFRPDGIHRLWDRFLNGDPRVNWSRIWQLVVLEDWLSRHGIDG